MSSFHDWVKTAWTNLLTWFGLEEQKVASFLYPIFQDAKTLVKDDLLKDIIDGIPVIATALGGGYAAALAAATQFILPVLEKQGKQLADETIGTLANALVAQAKASIPASTDAAA